MILLTHYITIVSIRGFKFHNTGAAARYGGAGGSANVNTVLDYGDFSQNCINSQLLFGVRSCSDQYYVNKFTVFMVGVAGCLGWADQLSSSKYFRFPGFARSLLPELPRVGVVAAMAAAAVLLHLAVQLQSALLSPI